MGKGARLKKKRLKEQSNVDFEVAVTSIPSFIVIMKLLNDVLYRIITIEESKNDKDKLLEIVNKASTTIDGMMVEVKRRQSEYENKVSMYKKEYKANPNDPILSVEILKNLALDQMENIMYLKSTFPLYNEEFCNLLSMPNSEEGKEEFKSLKDSLEGMINDTIGLLSTFTIF